MNNILNHRGYKFFQSSFDPDEKGTILSVNHDYWGTWFTYLGYYLLYFGLMAYFAESKHARMEVLRNQLDKIKKKKSKLYHSFIMLSLSMVHTTSQHSSDHTNVRPTQTQLDSILNINITLLLKQIDLGI
jgi:hypothetical protein